MPEFPWLFFLGVAVGMAVERVLRPAIMLRLQIRKQKKAWQKQDISQVIRDNLTNNYQVPPGMQLEWTGTIEFPVTPDGGNAEVELALTPEESAQFQRDKQITLNQEDALSRMKFRRK